MNEELTIAVLSNFGANVINWLQVKSRVITDLNDSAVFSLSSAFCIYLFHV